MFERTLYFHGCPFDIFAILAIFSACKDTTIISHGKIFFHYRLKMSLCFSRRRVWGFLFTAVLLHEAEGEFAAVGGGDGEEVGGRGA